MSTMGERICARRKELGLTMEDVGRALGVQRPAVNKWEKDINELKGSQIKKLAEVLDVSVFYILDDEPTDEDRLLVAYRNAEKSIRRAALQMLEDSAGIVRDQHEREEASS